jgi:hypothetical protein
MRRDLKTVERKRRFSFPEGLKRLAARLASVSPGNE